MTYTTINSIPSHTLNHYICHNIRCTMTSSNIRLILQIYLLILIALWILLLLYLLFRCRHHRLLLATYSILLHTLPRFISNTTPIPCMLCPDCSMTYYNIFIGTLPRRTIQSQTVSIYYTITIWLIISWLYHDYVMTILWQYDWLYHTTVSLGRGSGQCWSQHVHIRQSAQQ